MSMESPCVLHSAKSRVKPALLLAFAFLLALASTACLDKEALQSRHMGSFEAERKEGEAVLVGTIAQEGLMRALSAQLISGLGVTADYTATDFGLALEAVASGEADAALVNSNELAGDSLDDFVGSSKIIAQDGVKFIVHPDSVIDDISEDDILALASDDKEYFEDYDYEVIPRFLARDNDSYDWQFMLQVFDITVEGPDGSIAEVERNPESVEDSDMKIVEQVLADENTIGMVSLDTDVGNALVLTLEGAELSDPEYPLAMPLILVWREPPNEVARAVINLFDSEQGAQLLVGR